VENTNTNNDVETTEGGRKQREKVFIEVDGQQVPAARCWGQGTFEAGLVSDFRQWCRDTNQDPRTVVGNIIEAGMPAIFQQVAETKQQRDASRRVVRPGLIGSLNTAEALAAAEAQLEAQLAAIRQRSEAIRAGGAEVAANFGGANLSDVLGTPSDDDVPTEGEDDNEFTGVGPATSGRGRKG
jgi:hypothetical protein